MNLAPTTPTPVGARFIAPVCADAATLMPAPPGSVQTLLSPVFCLLSPRTGGRRPNDRGVPPAAVAPPTHTQASPGGSGLGTGSHSACQAGTVAGQVSPGTGPSDRARAGWRSE